MSTVHFWRYTLRPVQRLNAVSAPKAVEGALIRIRDGVGCLQPWPELGDASLDEHLQALARGDWQFSPLLRGCLACAREDGAARREGRSLFAGPIPESHWLVREGDDPRQAWLDGFRLAKIKAGPDLPRVLAEMEAWAGAGLALRLDFNESLASGGFVSFWTQLDEELRGQVDAVEDPEVWTEEGWYALRRLGVPLAVDRQAAQRLRPGDQWVWKPAYGEDHPLSAHPLYVTTNMDHAWGQFWAAACAAKLAAGAGRELLRPCGLLTHRCFESDPFFELIRCEGARLMPPSGSGLGFDELIETLPWRRLN